MHSLEEVHANQTRASPHGHSRHRPRQKEGPNTGGSATTVAGELVIDVCAGESYACDVYWDMIGNGYGAYGGEYSYQGYGFYY